MTATVAAVADGSTLRSGAELLPDLDQAKPDGLRVQRAWVRAVPRWRLGFISAAENVGRGPLRISGAREHAEGRMAASQIVGLEDGSAAVSAEVGELEYVVQRSHRHWHLLDFMRYELRRARDFRLVREDRKTGFCLGDRYRAPWDRGRRLPPLPTAPPEPVFVFDCGSDDPTALTVDEGISVGWGDVYEPYREGQYVDITNLRGGMYVLVHRVNPGRRLREARYDNNASSLVFELRWPRGRDNRPVIELRGRCADVARCKPQW